MSKYRNKYAVPPGPVVLSYVPARLQDRTGPLACAMDRCPGPEVGPILFPRVRLWRRARLQGTPVFVIPKVPICPACRGRIKVEDIMGAPETRARLATVLAARARRPEPAWATAELGWIDPSAVA